MSKEPTIAARNNAGIASLTADLELLFAVALLACAAMIGVATASDYGISIDEFDTDDNGPKALAWYTSGFTDRSHFETIEFSLWYYGPWFHMLTSLWLNAWAG